ncbi:MAG: radical SAM protein [Chloroflexi bacterium]|nr:radical SAM protein [Chloroflexota bacterium]
MTFIRPEIIRPPSEHASYYLPLTAGCSNNSCTFCNYSMSHLSMRDLDEVKREIDAVSLYMNHHVRVSDQPEIVYAILRRWNGKKLFLQDGDALVYPYPKLIEILRYLNEKLPGLERIASYATPQDILRRTTDELKTLKDLKLGILYMGVESGDDEVIQRIHKGVTHDQMVEAARKVKESGILLSVTVILGLGGLKGSQRHALETARILTEMDPDYAGALTLTLIPGTPLYDEFERDEFDLISPFDSLRELKTIVENSNFTNCFFSSMHASNYFAIRGQMPADKERVIKQLDTILAKRDPALLRPEFLRGL